MTYTDLAVGDVVEARLPTILGPARLALTIDAVTRNSDGSVFLYHSEERNIKPEDVLRVITRHADKREQRTTSSTGGQKGIKPEKFSLIPVEALAKVAEHYGVGAEKYAAHQWRKGYEWSKSYDALQRHATAFWAGEDNDSETGTPHMAAVAFHALTLLTFMDEQPNHDDRYKDES